MQNRIPKPVAVQLSFENIAPYFQIQLQVFQKAISVVSKHKKGHRRLHTSRGLILCIHCNKCFPTNHGMMQHAVIHQGQVHKCTQCGHTTNISSNSQHVRGKHGPGWPSQCGKKFDWPAKMHRHTKRCDDCRKIIVKKNMTST